MTKTLSENDLHRLVPAAFAQAPAEHTSERYSFIPTSELITQITDRGWKPVAAGQSMRIANHATTKHMIRFRQPDVKIEVGGTLPEIVLINSHDATKRFSLLAGFFRLVCSNGLIIGTGIGETKVNRVHIDGADVSVDEALTSAMDRLDKAITQIDVWQQTDLGWGTRQQFAKDAIVVRNRGDKIWSDHFSPRDFLVTRRATDKRNDLWTTFNVLQENILKGGVQGVTRMTKPITQVSEVARINTELWQLAEKYGTLHSRS